MKNLLVLFVFCLCCFTGSAQILNGDFENWYTDTAGHNRLYNWQHFDFGITNNFFLGTWEVSDAAHGSNALKLSRWYSYRSDWVMQRASIASKPGSLDGYYKYINNQLMSPYNVDTAVVYIWLTAWNSITAQNDTIGIGKSLLMASDSYIQFSCPISYPNAGIPDSLTILIKPSVWYNNAVFSQGACLFSGFCSALTIDNLFLAEPSAVKYLNDTRQISVYPDPAYDKLTVAAGSKINNVVIYDLVGKEIYSSAYNNDRIEINMTAFPAGMCMIVVTDDDGKRTVKKIFKR
jgi:hypothetical protein